MGYRSQKGENVVFKIEALFVNPDYPPELARHNTDLVCYVVRRSDNKVLDVAVVARPALHDWFVQRRAKFEEAKHYFVLGTTAIVGVLRGIDAKEFLDAAKAADTVCNEANKPPRDDFNPNVN